MNRERIHSNTLGGSKIRTLMCGIALAGLLTLTVSCSAQTRGATGGGEGGGAQFNRPATLYVGYGPGGGSDQAARQAAPAIAKDLGVEVPVVNSPGGSGNAAFTNMLGDPPGESIALYTDGTLTAVASGVASYELEEIQGVCRMQDQAGGILLKGDGPYENWEDLASAAKERPGELTVGTSGQGTIDDIMIAALAEQGFEFRAVPFDEPTERYSALLGGSIDALFEQSGDVVDDIESGQMKQALLFADEPMDGLKGEYVLGPDIGVDLALNQSRGIVTSAEATPEQVKALSDACASTQQDEEWTKFQEQNLSEPGSFMASEEYDAYLQDQFERFKKLANKYDVG